MIDRLQAAAYIHRPHRVAGRLLAPMGARHWLALEHAGSPFVTAGEGSIDDPAELIIAAEVLAARSEPGIAEILLRDISTEEGAAWLDARLGELAAMDLDAERVELQLYLDSYLGSAPRPLDPGPGRAGKPSTCHPAILLASRAMVRLGLSRREAWWSPIAELRWELHARDEIEGGEPIPIVSERSIATLVEDGHLTAEEGAGILAGAPLPGAED